MRRNRLTTSVALMAGLSLITAAGYATNSRHKGAGAPPVAAGQVAVSTTSHGAPPELQRRNPRYQLTNGDVVELVFPYTTEFNQKVTVQPDGFINLRGAGDIHVEGKTLPEMVESVKKAYAKVLHDPVVTANLQEFNKPSFVAGGMVGRPGKYDLRGDTTLSEAVAMAGGLRDGAKSKNVLVFRKVSDQWSEVKVVDLNKVLKGQDVQEDLHQMPGDMIFVPKTRLAKFERFIPNSTVGTYYGATF